jgi:hypothetical protein
MGGVLGTQYSSPRGIVKNEYPLFYCCREGDTMVRTKFIASTRRMSEFGVTDFDLQKVGYNFRHP